MTNPTSRTDPHASRPPRHGLRLAIHDAADRVLDLAYRSGVPAAVAYQLGLQGRVRISRHEFPVRRCVPDRAAPLRVAFASDFHAGPATHPRQIHEACRLLAGARPDVLLLGGDFVSINVGHVDEVAARIGAIPAPLGRFAVLGNHDYRRGRAGIVARALELHGIEVLHNASVRLPAPFDDISICGLDDFEAGTPEPDTMLADAAPTRLVVMHGPDGLLAMAGHRFDVAFCGHTHGGQVATPWGAPIIMPGGTLNRTFSHGEFAVRGGDARAILLVSRGIGCSGVPVRLFAWPEVHVCDIGDRGCGMGASE